VTALSKPPNKLVKNVVLFVLVLAAVLIVKKFWLPDGVIGLFE
jgi:hypothetical protein